MDYEKLKKLLIKNMNVNEKTMHILSIGEYVKRITVKEFFEVLENAINTVEKEEDGNVQQYVVSGSFTPFWESIKLLRDLADLQNGAPLEQHKKEWEETLERVYDFLNRWEGQ